MRLALITPSFSRDHELCANLCRSVDTYETDGMEHILVVPRADVPLFRPLAGPRRRIVAKEDVIPTRLMKAPLPTRVGIPGVWHKRLRTVWVTPKLKLVRGWIIQQITKMSANRLTDADGYVFLDSDIEFIRPFGAAAFMRDGRLPLLYEPDCIEHSLERYTAWQDAACDLLGIDRFPYANDNYIGQVICWRRDRLGEIQARIEATTGRPYDEALFATPTFAEYVIYGLYCRLVANGDSGHYLTDRSICLSDWSYDTASAEGYRTFTQDLKEDQIAVLIQSTTEWPMERRRSTIETIRANAGIA